MRFLVEVNALGHSEAKRYGIEAESWQNALQETRKLRGDEGPISGFSIELLDDGCRAVDPMARLRYVVKKGDVALGLGPLADGVAVPTHPPKAPSPSSPSMSVPATRMPAVAPVGVASVAPVPPSASNSAPPRASRGPGPGVSIRPSGAPRVPSAAPAVPAARPAAAAPSPPAAPPSVRPPPPAPSVRAVPPPAPSAPAGVTPSAPRVPAAPITKPQVSREDPAPAAAKSSLHVLARREEAPTAQKPLYYREEAVLVPAGAPDAALEEVLRQHLVAMQGDLARHARGKYVQIAGFDAPPPDKQTRPIVVLSWKDWKGEPPSFHYPRRAGASLGPSLAPVPPQAAVPMQADTAGAYAAQGSRPNVASATATVAGAFPTPGMNAGMAHPPSSARTPSGALRTASSGGFAAADGTGRHRRPVGSKRVPAEELIAQLFEEMHALHFLNDTLEGGHFCLAVAMEKLPSKAAYVHLYDIDKREFVLVCTYGLNTEPLLLSRTGESDALLSAAMRRRRAVVINDAAESGTNAARFAPVGGAKRMIVTPVMLSGRFLGAIELVNPIDGAPFTEAEGNAVTYMAEQFAEFVAARGVVLEPEKVSRASEAARA